MKRIFKHIIRKVDEKVSNTIKDITECINTVRDTMKNKDDLINFGMLFIRVGVGIRLVFAFIGTCMIIVSKIM